MLMRPVIWYISKISRIEELSSQVSLFSLYCHLCICCFIHLMIYLKFPLTVGTFLFSVGFFHLQIPLKDQKQQMPINALLNFFVSQNVSPLICHKQRCTEYEQFVIFITISRFICVWL